MELTIEKKRQVLLCKLWELAFELKDTPIHIDGYKEKCDKIILQIFPSADKVFLYAVEDGFQSMMHFLYFLDGLSDYIKKEV